MNAHFSKDLVSTMSEDLISSLYPAPPPYYKYFTQENLSKLTEWRANANDENVPKGLTFLIPPTQPEGSHYSGYGNIWQFEDKLPSLKDLGLRQLYPEDDESITSKVKIHELRRLMDLLLLNFLELIGTMSIEPAQFHVKIEDLKLVLININHLLNTYRPHQTRESLIMLLKKQIDKKKRDIAQVEAITNEIKSSIANLASEVSETVEIETKEASFQRSEAISRLLVDAKRRNGT